jgi:hypothetical protein
LPRAYKKRESKVYSPEVAETLCDILAMGHTLSEACRRVKWHEATVRRWVVFDIYPDFTTNYGRARLVAYHKMADELVAKAENPGWTETRIYEGRKLVRRVRSEATDRARLVADKKQWLLSKALPKVYGRDIGKDDEGGAAADLINQPYVVTIPAQFGTAEEWMASIPPDPAASE